MVGHGVPILPHGDPNAQKPMPRLHLDSPVHNDEAVRQEIIDEESKKEELRENMEQNTEVQPQELIGALDKALENPPDDLK